MREKLKGLLLIWGIGACLLLVQCRTIEEWCKKHPEICAPRPTPTATPTSSPEPTIGPTSSPTPTPAPTPTSTPSPAATATPGPVATATPGVESPVLVMFKLQGFNPNRPYNCHNPEDGPKFQNQHICVKDSTEIFCNADGSKCGPCDTDHMDNYTTFCNNQDWDIVGGPHIHSISGATAEKDGDNPFYTNVHFTPGVSFTLCIRAPESPKTVSGQPVRVQGTAQTCVTEKY